MYRNSTMNLYKIMLVVIYTRVCDDGVGNAGSVSGVWSVSDLSVIATGLSLSYHHISTAVTTPSKEGRKLLEINSGVVQLVVGKSAL